MKHVFTCCIRIAGSEMHETGICWAPNIFLLDTSCHSAFRRLWKGKKPVF